MTTSRFGVPASHRRILDEQLERSRSLGFLGPGPVGSHVEHALELAASITWPDTARALDLGSGGGVPGLVLLVALPHVRWVLLDAAAKRTAFLGEAVAALGAADRAVVVTARAEEAGRRPDLRHAFDVVVARSFGPPAATAECGAPFLRPGGVLIVSEPPDDRDRWPAAGLAELGLRRCGPPPNESATTHHVVLESTGPCPERYPRRNGVPTKRPLFVSQET